MGASKRNLDAQSFGSSKHNGKKPKQYEESEYVPRYNNFTPLIQSSYNILMQVEPRGILTTPPRIKGPPSKRDMSKCCRYHCENGHVTNDY